MEQYKDIAGKRKMYQEKGRNIVRKKKRER